MLRVCCANISRVCDPLIMCSLFSIANAHSFHLLTHSQGALKKPFLINYADSRLKFQC